MENDRELNEFGRGQFIDLQMAGRSWSHEAQFQKALLHRRRKRSVQPTNFHELENIQEDGEKFHQKLIESMPHRIEACIKNQGWPTKY